MSYSAYLAPRKETLSDEGIEGIIDLANLASGDSRKIEANPELLVVGHFQIFPLLLCLSGYAMIKYGKKENHRSDPQTLTFLPLRSW